MGRESSEQRERGQSSGGTFLMVCAILPEWWAPEENVGGKGGGRIAPGVGAMRGGAVSAGFTRALSS